MLHATAQHLSRQDIVPQLVGQRLHGVTGDTTSDGVLLGPVVQELVQLAVLAQEMLLAHPSGINHPHAHDQATIRLAKSKA